MKYPKDLNGRETTKEQWDRYNQEMIDHETRMREKEPKKFDYGFTHGWPDRESEQKFDKAYSEWHQAYFMDMPNKPGYYRANND